MKNIPSIHTSAPGVDDTNIAGAIRITFREIAITLFSFNFISNPSNNLALPYIKLKFSFFYET